MNITYEYNTHAGRGHSLVCDVAPSLEALGARKVHKVESICVGLFDARQGAEAFASQNLPKGINTQINQGCIIPEPWEQKEVQYGFFLNIYLNNYSGDRDELFHKIESQAYLLG